MAMRSTKSADRIVDDLLRLLVQWCGYPYVVARLGALKVSDASPGGPEVDNNNGSKHRKFTASEYVKSIDIAPCKKDVLILLAKKFENREFLPTLGAIKDFLQRKNVRVDSLSGRTAAFAKIVEILKDLPEDNLKLMLQDENYSGPSRLGPLSDAIKAHGAAIRFNK